MSDSDSSGDASPSPVASPVASVHEPPGLERLVAHFVSAKRSLGSTEHVWRANELVTSCRTLIEDIAILNAKSSFARNGVGEELATLQTTRNTIYDVGKTADDEFKQTLASLDEANDRLQSTLKIMRNTVVDPSLQPIHEHPTNENETPGLEKSETTQRATTEKALYDFIDEANHEEILGSLRELIDSFNDARADLDDSLASFDKSIENISDSLDDKLESSGPNNHSTIYDGPPQTISQLFHAMEGHAADMAHLLQSLVSHYDLSVTALKHTEGGGEAAKMAIQAEELIKNEPGSEESLYDKTAPEPISEDERTEMLKVLEGDALEVDDVILEIQDHLGEMETQYNQLVKRASLARSTHSSLRSALSTLYKIRESLPSYFNSARTFQELWLNIQESLRSRTKDLIDLSGFHSSFVSSYEKLLQEVSRRQAAELQMRKLADKTRREMDRLYEADRLARLDFMERVGDFLPGDIWGDLQTKAPRWTVGKAVTGNEEL